MSAATWNTVGFVEKDDCDSPVPLDPQKPFNKWSQIQITTSITDNKDWFNDWIQFLNIVGGTLTNLQNTFTSQYTQSKDQKVNTAGQDLYSSSHHFEHNYQDTSLTKARVTELLGNPNTRQSLCDLACALKAMIPTVCSCDCEDKTNLQTIDQTLYDERDKTDNLIKRLHGLNISDSDMISKLATAGGGSDECSWQAWRNTTERCGNLGNLAICLFWFDDLTDFCCI